MSSDSPHSNDPSGGAAASRLESFRAAWRSAGEGQRSAVLDRAVGWIAEGASPDERDAILRSLLVGHAEGASANGASGRSGDASASPAPTPPTPPTPEPSPAPRAVADALPHADDLLHETWSQLGGASDDVDLQRLAGVARAACFAFLMEIDEFAARLYNQVNFDQALIEGALRDRIAEYLNTAGDPDPESLLRIIKRRRTAVLYLLHLAGTAGWVFWQDIVRDRLDPDRLEQAGGVAGSKQGGADAAWSAYRERFKSLNSKEALDSLWLSTARSQLSRLFAHKD